MKKLLKIEIFESVNSAWVHYSWLTWSNSAVGTKKKKKLSENANASTYNSNPNTY